MAEQRMEQFNIRIERALIEQIDSIVSQDKTFRDRSDYIRTRLREGIIRDKKRFLDEKAIEIAKIIKARGAKPGLPTNEERERIADEFLKEKGIKIPHLATE